MNICIAHGGDLSEPSGGTDRITAFAAGLQNNGFDVVLVVPEPTGAVPNRISDVEITTVPLHARGIVDQPLRALLVSKRAKKIARKRDLQLQIEHSTLAGVSTLIGCNGYVLDMLDFAYPSPLYGDLPFGSGIQRIIRSIEGRALKKAKQIIVVSERMQDLITKEWPVSSEQITVIPNGYFTSTIDSYRNIETIKGRVVFLGTLHPKVDADVLISIAKLPDVTEMFVIGDGARRDELEAARDRLGLTSLRITGRLPDEEAFKLLAGADVAVNPQYPSRLQEASSPVKLYSYAALGLPMVLTEGPDAARWLEEEGAAITLSPQGEFVDTVQSILTNEEKRRTMAQRAVKASQGANWHNRVSELIEVHKTSYENNQ